MGAARDFLSVLGTKELPLFNPIKGINNNKIVSEGNNSGVESIHIWNETAKRKIYPHRMSVAAVTCTRR